MKTIAPSGLIKEDLMNTDAVLTSQQPPSGAARPFVVDWRRSFLDGRLPASTMGVGYTLAEYANGDGTRAYPGEKNLSRCVSLTERAVRRHLKALLTAGWVTQESPGFPGHHAVYRLAIPSGIRPAPEQDRPAVGTRLSAVAPEQRTAVSDEPGTATSGYQEPVQSPTTPYQDHGLDGGALREKPSSLRSSKTTVEAETVTSCQPPAPAVNPDLTVTADTSISEIRRAYPDYETDPHQWALLVASVLSQECLQTWPYSRPIDVSTLAKELHRLQKEHSQEVIDCAWVGWLKLEPAQRSQPGWDAEASFTSTFEHHIALTHKSMKEGALEMAEELARDLPDWWPEQNLPKANTHVLASTILPLVEQHGWPSVEVGLDLWLEDKGGQPCKNPFGLFCSQIADYVGIAEGGRKPISNEETEEEDDEDEGAAGSDDFD